MTRKVVIAALAMAAIGLNARWIRAQGSVLSELYGQGVHAYFANDYGRAHDWLTKAIAQGSQDPRCYYFRALSYRRLGRPDEARMDFEKGAMLEASSRSRVYPVGRSLQRIQGPSRMVLEGHRREARLALRLKNLKAAQARYEASQRADDEVVRGARETPKVNASELVREPSRRDPADPFGAPDEAPVPAPKREKPAIIAADAAPVPPRGTTAGAAASTPSGGTPSASPPGDPFGGDATASSDPFGGGGASPAPAGGAADATDDPFGGDADPFGGGGTTTPAGDAPSTPDSDPFGGGDATPAAGGDASDPFGEMPSNPFEDDEPEDSKPAENPAAGSDSSDDPFGT